MKLNPPRYSSAVGEVWVMATFKVKYCHKIFNLPAVREECDRLFCEAMQHYNIRFQKVGFDEDHVHILLDLGIDSKPQIAKKLKGYTGKKLLSKFPAIKKRYFWGSGLWNPAYDIRSHDVGVLSRYIDKQKYAAKGQKMLSAF